VSLFIHKEQNMYGDYIPRRVEVNLWVALYPGKRCGHFKDSKKYSISIITSAYKAKILKFQLRRNTIFVVKVKVHSIQMLPIIEFIFDYKFVSNHT